MLTHRSAQHVRIFMGWLTAVVVSTMVMMMMMMMITMTAHHPANAFSSSKATHHNGDSCWKKTSSLSSSSRRIFLLATSPEDDNIPTENDDDDDALHPIMEEARSRMDSIQVEKARTQLEHANTQSFLKRRPIKLPYDDARRWIQANLGCDTKEEHDDLVANGNLRTPYIPKNPEEYYKKTREWISWDHYLKGCFDGQHISAVQPQTGIFD